MLIVHSECTAPPFPHYAGLLVDDNGVQFRRTTHELCTLVPPIVDETSSLDEVSLQLIRQVRNLPKQGVTIVI